MHSIRQLPPLPSLREIIRIYGLRAQKQLSQNFLLQPSSINNFVKYAGNLSDAYVLEVGPGPGGLTRAILERKPRHLAVVEVDRRFLPGLQEVALAATEMGMKMDIYRQDILKFNCEHIFPIEEVTGPECWTSSLDGANSYSEAMNSNLSKNADATSLIDTQACRVRIIGNLPFNISTPLLSQWLHDISERRGLWRLGRVPMLLTFQQEVGERLVADIWDNQRSRLSIMAQALCKVELVKIISGSAFVPKPEVHVALVRFTPLKEPVIPVPFPFMNKLIRQAFQFRNKQIIRCLETLFPSDRPDLVIRLMKEAAVQPVKKSTEISLLEFRDLCTVYYQICQSEPNCFNFDYQSRDCLHLWTHRKVIQRDVLNNPTGLSSDYVRRQIYK